jgi:hypothetical protein
LNTSSRSANPLSFCARYLPLAAVLCLLAAPSLLVGQFAGSIVVHVAVSDGSSLDRGVVVSLFTFGGGSVGVGQMKGGQVDFEGIPEGRYSLEVIPLGTRR